MFLLIVFETKCVPYSHVVLVLLWCVSFYEKIQCLKFTINHYGSGHSVSNLYSVDPWLHFPIRLAFTITINKSQVQSLEMCSLNLDPECFANGQQYFACSRISKPDNLYMYARKENQIILFAHNYSKNGL